MAAVTLTLQIAVAIAFLAFGLLTIASHRRSPGARPEHRTALLLLGLAFAADGGSMLAHNVAAVFAYLAGSASAFYAAYMAWSPALNHSRTFLLVAFTVMLTIHALRSRTGSRRFVAASGLAMLGGFVAGVVVGRLEPDFSPLTHYSAVASWEVLQLVVLLVALFATLLRSRIDRYAWVALAIYGFYLALNVMWVAALSRRGIEGEWSPQPWMIHAYRLVLTLVMIAVAVRRLQLARRGVPVSALMDSAPSRLRMVG